MIQYAEEIKKLNLFEKISNISSEVEYLQKDDKVGFGSNSYRAISIEKVVTSVAEKMVKYGVVIFPSKQEYNRQDEKVVNSKGEEKINRISDVNVEYTVVNIHNPSEKIVVVSSGCGVDTQDKGIGKAMTYAYKNMIIKLFNIATGDDSDKIHSDDYTRKLLGESPSSISEKLTDKQLNRLYALANKKGLTPERTNGRIKEKYGVQAKDMSREQYDEICSALEK